MYAGVVIDIANQEVDRVFTYKIPDALYPDVRIGAAVNVPFGAGNRIRKGFVVSLEEFPNVDEAKVKAIDRVIPKANSVEEELISLAVWIRHRYGGTLYQCLQTVMPVKTQTEERKARFYVWKGTDEELSERLETAQKKKHYAKCRLLEAFLENRRLPSMVVSDRLRVTETTLKPLKEAGVVEVEAVGTMGKAYSAGSAFSAPPVQLNEEQRQAAERILSDPRPVQVLFGVTGSGKTEVYMELIERTLEKGKDAIVLIPEIALTFQTVMRFYNRFGEQVSFVHSRLSAGEKSARFEAAKEKRVRVMIGPRSALFTPFKDLGLIVIDEFHERSYQSDQVPKYDAVETAIERVSSAGAKLVLGSATPAVSVFQKALNGTYGLLKLTRRAVAESALPDVEIVDLREELKNGNKSIFSKVLKEKIEDRLSKHEQVMLFLNRRGYSGPVTCRSCGESIPCVHCSTSLILHERYGKRKLKCHICGYEREMVTACPKCGSKLIGSFGIGTEKVERLVEETFPGARVLRMDADTTSGKEGHREILEKFIRQEADVLIGTQMIVKGHDFKNVTLVGILAADLSLFIQDYRSAETTFELLVQAEGRAGRDLKKGECVIQTYNPGHYAIRTAKEQDYEAFYREEIAFRAAAEFPPAKAMLRVRFSGADEKALKETVDRLTGGMALFFALWHITVLGPAEEIVSKVKDQYRYGFYLKCDALPTLLAAKRELEKEWEKARGRHKFYMSFEG